MLLLRTRRLTTEAQDELRPFILISSRSEHCLTSHGKPSGVIWRVPPLVETANTSVKTRAPTDIRYRQIWPEFTERPREGTHCFEDTGMLPFWPLRKCKGGAKSFVCWQSSTVEEGGFKLLLTKIRHTVSPRDTDLW